MKTDIIIPSTSLQVFVNCIVMYTYFIILMDMEVVLEYSTITLRPKKKFVSGNPTVPT